MKSISFIFIFQIIGILSFYSQNANIPLNNYYKNSFLKYSGKKSLETFYPANESYLNLSDSLKDTSIFYYDFYVWFFQKNWIELNEQNGKLQISPLVNFSYGKSYANEDSLPLYRNTRGVYATGQLFNKLSFNFIFCENQNRFTTYEQAYFLDRGEFYDNDSVFNKVNAVIPGGARTKPFNINEFDYAYSVGSFAYQASKNLRIEFGNNQHFIGSGYRSLLLSDNSIYAPALRVKWDISPKFSYQILYRKHRNLYRKPSTKAVELPYENKLFAASYLTYKPLENFSISLFSAGNQLRADSNSMHPIEAQMLIPLPFVTNDLFYDSKTINGISGLNFDLAFQKLKLYGQIALDKYQKTYLTSYQIGIYHFSLFGIDQLNLQAEFNHVPQHFYASSNTKLAYSQYNLPLAHPKGNNFDEIYLNLEYSYKRLYIRNMLSLYLTQGGLILDQIAGNTIFSNEKTGNLSKGSTTFDNLELGYRINRKYNPTIFCNISIRASDFGVTKFQNNYIMCGLKVNLLNQYLDF